MKVFLCETIHPEAYRLLSEHAEIISSRERMGEADALISRVISVGAAEMDAMPGLKVGTGTDGIDLAEALESGRLGGAAADVLQDEFPGADHPLLQFPNFVVTPHIGANTDEALYDVGMCCVRQILDVLAGKAAEYPVV